MTENNQTKFFYGWIAVLVALGIYIVSYGMSTVFSVFLKPLIVQFGWSRAATSGAYSLNQFTFGVSAFLSGYLSDRYGTRKVLLISAVIYSAGLILASQTKNIWQLYLFYGLLIGMGYGSLTVPSVTAVTKWFERSRGLAVGITQGGIGVGTFILSPLAAFLITKYGWQSTYVILGFIALLVLIPAALIIRDNPSMLGLKPYGHNIRGGENHSILPKEVDISLPSAMKTQTFWLLNLIHMSDCLCHSVVLLHIVAYLTDLGINTKTAAGIYGISGAASALGTVLSGLFVDKIGGKNSLTLAVLLQAMTVFLLLFSQSLWIFYVIAFFMGLGMGGLVTPYPVLTREYFGEKAVGTIYGIQLGFATSGMALGGGIGGYLFDYTGSYHYAFIFSLTAGIVALFLALCLSRSPTISGQAALVVSK